MLKAEEWYPHFKMKAKNNNNTASWRGRQNNSKNAYTSHAMLPATEW